MNMPPNAFAQTAFHLLLLRKKSYNKTIRWEDFCAKMMGLTTSTSKTQSKFKHKNWNS